MTVTQISFCGFAANAALAASACTPPAVNASASGSSQAAAGPGACILPYGGVFQPINRPYSLDMGGDGFEFVGAAEYCLDAPEFLPRGCHAAVACGGEVIADGFASYRPGALW